jgi:Crp-like helix-turn-helix domain
MSHDRCVCDDLPLTQEFLSLMLGVRRAGVTESANTPHNEGYITHRRGHIKIIDRAGLENYSCDCYQIVKEEFDLLEGQKNFISFDSRLSTPDFRLFLL